MLATIATVIGVIFLVGSALALLFFIGVSIKMFRDFSQIDSDFREMTDKMNGEWK